MRPYSSSTRSNIRATSFSLDRFEGRSSLKTWILRIVSNQAKTRAVRERRTVPFSALERYLAVAAPVRS